MFSKHFFMKNNRIESILTGISVILTTTLALNTAFAQLPPVTSGTCNINKITYLTSSDIATTPITRSYVNLADLHDLDVTIADGQCVMMEVSFTLVSPTSGHIELRAMFDDGPNTVPSSIKISPGFPLGYHTFTFLVPVETGLGPGFHHIDIEVRGQGGSSIVTKNRSITVLHN